MRLLLDTHAVIWWFAKQHLLSRTATAAISEPSNEVFVSAVVAYEITFKYRRGRLADAEGLADRILSSMSDAQFRWLDISPRHAIWAGELQSPNVDPFDRLLMAQTTLEDLVLVTADRRIRQTTVPTLW